MLLRHATPARNLPGILKAGLLTSKSQGRLPAVWLHSPSCSAWAGWHTVRRHGGRIEQVVILEIDAPRRWLRRSKKGLWYCPRDVPPERIRGSSPSPRWHGRPSMTRRRPAEQRGGTGKRHPFRSDSSPVKERQSHV